MLKPNDELFKLNRLATATIQMVEQLARRYDEIDEVSSTDTYHLMSGLYAQLHQSIGEFLALKVTLDK